MTAANLFVGDSEAHLVSDRAFPSFDGTLLTKVSKIAASPPLRMAISLSGYARSDFPWRIAEWLELQRDQETAMHRLHNLVDALDKVMVHNPGARDSDPRNNIVVLTVAIWSEARRQPEGYLVTSGQGRFPPSVVPGRPFGVKRYTSPQTDVDTSAGAGFRIHRDWMQLLTAQRAATEDHGYSVVGCGVDIARVHQGGVELANVHTWPDRIGERINPDD